MKKLLGIVVLGLLWCNLGLAEMRVIEEKNITSKEFVNLSVATVCIDGYKFVISKYNNETSIAQFYEKFGTRRAVPVKCK